MARTEVLDTVLDRAVTVAPHRVLFRLPRWLAIPLLARRDPNLQELSGSRAWQVDDRIQVLAHWIDFRGDSGPGTIAMIDGEEILRIDFLDRDPHVHYCVAESRYRHGHGRVWVADRDVESLIDRAQWELERNLAFSLHLHRRRSIQRHRPDSTVLGLVAAEVATHHRTLAARHRVAAAPAEQGVT